MIRSRIIVGVIGGGEQRDVAQRLGAAVAAHDQILLTGGQNQDSLEVKDAAIFGAAKAAMSNGYTARLIGILSRGKPDWSPVIEVHARSFFLHTGLGSAERDCITGATPDALIVLRGSTGTLTELAFACTVGRPVLLLSSRNWLIERTREHSPKHLELMGGDGKLRHYLSRASAVYAKSTQHSIPVPDLESALKGCLESCEEFSEGDEDAAVKDILRRASKAGGSAETAFPGLPDDPARTRDLFNSVIRKLDE